MVNGPRRFLGRRPTALELYRARRRRLPRLKRWRTAKIVLASAYDPKTGRKRNLEIHITMPLTRRTTTEKVVSLLESSGVIDEFLAKTGYDIPPMSDLDIGIQWESKEMSILDVPRDVEIGLMDYDYGELRAEASGTLKRLSILDEGNMIAVRDTIIPDTSIHRGRKGVRGERVPGQQGLIKFLKESGQETLSSLGKDKIWNRRMSR